MARFTSASRSAAVLASIAAILSASGPCAWAQEQLPWQQSGAKPERYSAPMNVGANDAYRSSGEDSDASPARSDDAYNPSQGGASNGEEAYRPSERNDSFSDPATAPRPERQGYGEPYSPPPQTYEDASRDPGGPSTDPRRSSGFDQHEIVGAGHRFFGGVSGGIANAIESVFKSQGRPNGYILGQDAGGAFILGLRYGEGTMFTKDAGEHRVFWQGPSIGYDAGGDGSKTMVLVYNLRDPSEIYERFGGVQGAAYIVGGVSVQIQRYNDVTLAVIRSGVGLRLGANVGYMKYTRSPTWNPL